MARSSECTERYAHKVFDSADIVREGMLREGSSLATAVPATKSDPIDLGFPNKSPLGKYY